MDQTSCGETDKESYVNSGYVHEAEIMSEVLLPVTNEIPADGNIIVNTDDYEVVDMDMEEEAVEEVNLDVDPETGNQLIGKEKTINRYKKAVKSYSEGIFKSLREGFTKIIISHYSRLF